MALLCEALATDDDPEVGDTILGVLSPAWKSGAVDVPVLLRGVQRVHPRARLPRSDRGP